MKNYLDDLLVCAIILSILLPIVIALFRRKRLFIFILGALLVIGAVPATIMSEISINGCCGAPSTGYEGIEYLIGGVMVIVGILVVVFSKKLAKS